MEATSHQDTRWARATSLVARPDTTTAATRAWHNRAVDRAKAGTWSVTSLNVPRGHRPWSQNQRRLTHTTSVGPPIGRSQIGRQTSELQSRQYLVCRLLLEKK